MRLAQLEAGAFTRLPYRPPTGILERVEAFVRSTKQVFVLEGALGVGKTSFCFYAARHLSLEATSQLHLLPSFDPLEQHLAVAICEYAGLPKQRLDELASTLSASDMPWLIIVDGVADQDRWSALALQVEQLLGVVPSGQVFFLLTRRPLALTREPYPLFAASEFQPIDSSGVSARLTPWDDEEASKAWDDAGSGRPYMALPRMIRHWLRVPLYMRRAIEGSGGNDAVLFEMRSPFQFLTWFLDAALGRVTGDSNAGLTALASLVQQQFDAEFRKAIQWSHRAELSDGDDAAVQAGLLLVRSLTDGYEISFGHDSTGEYMVARALVEEALHEEVDAQGVRARLGSLVQASATSATAAHILKMCLFALHDQAPSVLQELCLLSDSEPALLRSALDASHDLPELMTGAALLRWSEIARSGNSVDLAIALVASERLFELDDTRVQVLELLRAFGSSIWPTITRSLSATAVEQWEWRPLLELVNYDDPLQARLAAYLLALLVVQGRPEPEFESRVRSHRNWHVRAAFSEALCGFGGEKLLAADLWDRVLVHDSDYKVRAAAAATVVPYLSGSPQYISTLLRDRNWHVRANALRATSSWPSEARAELEATLLAPDWAAAPFETRVLWWEAVLPLGIDPEIVTDDEALQRAAFVLLRTGRGGRDPGLFSRLARVAEVANSPELRRELERSTRGRVRGDAERFGTGEASAAFRRLRGNRTLQVALDCVDRRQAASMASKLQACGVPLLEVGDPLIKRYGAGVIGEIRQAAPDVALVAEMVCPDWGLDQVELAAYWGADVVMLLGTQSVRSIRTAVEAAQDYQLALVLDVALHRDLALDRGVTDLEGWVLSVQAAGVDGIVLTGNVVDVGSSGHLTSEYFAELRRWADVPIGVAGGYDVADLPAVIDQGVDIVIVGRAVVDAEDPVGAARQMLEVLGQGAENG
jgi:3-keto-L-gulonate-6-phosphate decarboxylase